MSGKAGPGCTDAAVDCTFQHNESFLVPRSIGFGDADAGQADLGWGSAKPAEGSLILLQPIYNLGQLFTPAVNLDSAGSDSGMAAATILQHQLADVRSAASVDDAVSDREDYILAVFSPQHPNLDVLFRMYGEDDEAIATEGRLFVHDVGYDNVALGFGGPLEHVHEERLMFPITFGPLHDVG